MRYRKLKTAIFFFSLALFGCKTNSYANFEDATTGQDRRGCGDYTILSNANDRAVFDRHCGTNKDKDFEILRELVKRLDPGREARSAALRGDFRLAAVTDGGPPRPDQKRLWHVAGFDCISIDDENVFIWLHDSDAIAPGSHFGYLIDMARFAKKYNETIIKEGSSHLASACTSAP